MDEGVHKAIGQAFRLDGCDDKEADTLSNEHFQTSTIGRYDISRGRGTLSLGLNFMYKLITEGAWAKVI